MNATKHVTVCVADHFAIRFAMPRAGTIATLVSICVAAFACMMVWPGAGLAQSETPAKTETPPSKKQSASPARPWVVNCSTSQSDGELVCQMSQQLLSSKTRQPLLSVIFRSSGKGKPLNMLVALPHGLFLPGGLSMQIDDGKARQSAIQTSDAKGVYAALPVTSDMLARLKAGNSLKVSMNNVQRRKLTIPVSLTGFTAAVEKLQSLN